MEEDENIVDRKKIVVKNGERAMPPMSREQELQMFKALAFKSFKVVGHEFGLHHFYSTDAQVRSAVMNIARKVRKAPELYGISQDAVEVVDEAAASRSINKNPKARSQLAIEVESFRDKLDAMRDTVAEIIKKKLDKAMKAKGGIDSISFRDLKDLLATTIDKGRLLRGESTENIAKFAKIDVDSLSPEDSLKMIMKAREALIEARK